LILPLCDEWPKYNKAKSPYVRRQTCTLYMKRTF